MQETWVWSLGWEDTLEKGKAPHLVFWPREFHGLYNAWSRKELDTTERLSLSQSHEGSLAASIKHNIALRDTGTSGTKSSIPQEFQAAALSRAAFSDQERLSVRETQGWQLARAAFNYMGDVDGVPLTIGFAQRLLTHVRTWYDGMTMPCTLPNHMYWYLSLVTDCNPKSLQSCDPTEPII